MSQLIPFVVVLWLLPFCYAAANGQDVCSFECVQVLLAPEHGLVNLIVRLSNANLTETENYSYLMSEIPTEMKNTFTSTDEAQEYLSRLHSTIKTFQQMGSRAAPAQMSSANSAEVTSTTTESVQTITVSTSLAERDIYQVSTKSPESTERVPLDTHHSLTNGIQGNLDYPVELQPDGRIVVLYEERRYDTSELQNLINLLAADERKKLIQDLRALGFPITSEGTPIADNYGGANVSVLWKPQSDGRVRMSIDNDLFYLPDDNLRVSEYLKRQPNITYDVLKKLRVFGICFNVDQGLEPSPVLGGLYTLKLSQNRIFITIRGVDYEIPAQLQDLSKKLEPHELRNVFDSLRRDGFPVTMSGNVMTASSAPAPARESVEARIHMDVIQQEKSVVLRIDGQKYRLPDQKELLLKILNERPTLRYEVLKLFLVHNVNVNLKTLDIELARQDVRSSSSSVVVERDNEPNYDLVTTKDGELEIVLAGTILKVPEDLPRLSQLVTSTTLVKIITRLRLLGIPVSMQNDRVVIHSERISSYRIEVEAKTRNNILVSVTISMNGERYVLPQDADAFQAAIHREPAMTFQLFKLLAKYHIPVEFNEKSGQVAFTFETDEDNDYKTTSDVPYEILSQNGKIIIRIGSEDLVIPRDLQRLSSILDKQNLHNLVSELKSFGTPVEVQGSRIAITREQKTSYRIALQVVTLRKQPIRAIVSINNDRFELPRDEESFQTFLMQVPTVKYKIFQLLSSKNIPMRYDNETKRLQINFSSTGGRFASNAIIPSAVLVRRESNFQNPRAYQKRTQI